MKLIRSEPFGVLVDMNAEIVRRGRARAAFHVADYSQITVTGRALLRELDEPVARAGHLLVVHPSAEVSEQPIEKFGAEAPE